MNKSRQVASSQAGEGTCLIHKEIKVATEIVQDDKLPGHQMVGQITSLEPRIYKSYDIHSYAVPVIQFMCHYTKLSINWKEDDGENGSSSNTLCTNNILLNLKRPR